MTLSQFYDCSLLNIKLVANSKTLVLLVSHYNEKENNYDLYKIRFYEITKIEISSFEFEFSEELTLDYVQKNEDDYKMLIDLGFGKGVIKILISNGKHEIAELNLEDDSEEEIE